MSISALTCPALDEICNAFREFVKLVLAVGGKILTYLGFGWQAGHLRHAYVGDLGTPKKG